MARDIYVTNPDEGALFDEYFYKTERDRLGLPLGNLRQHAQARLHNSYIVLCLCRLLGELGRIDKKTEFTCVGVGDGPQDKQTSGDTNAAHTLPGRIRVEKLPGAAAGTGSGAPVHLYDLFRDGVVRRWVEGVFARTYRVHTLTNKADTRCERNGMRRVFAEACKAVAEGGAPDSVFGEILLPGYRQAILRALHNLEGSLSRFETDDRQRVILFDAWGKPAGVRPEDTRTRSPDPLARAANRNAQTQILEIYAHVGADPAVLKAEATRIASFKRDEAKLG
jgi:hypothetical protein